MFFVKFILYNLVTRLSRFRDIKIENEIQIRRIRDECLESDHYRISWFGKTLLKRDKQLEAFCTHSTDEFKFTNAYTESINNQCKVAKRVSHGFKYKSSYKRKLSARFINLSYSSPIEYLAENNIYLS